MKHEVILLICLIFLALGITLVFYAKEISEKIKFKNKNKFIRIAKTTGFVVSLASLIIIYFWE